MRRIAILIMTCLQLLLPLSPAAAVIYAFQGVLTVAPADGPLVVGGRFFGDFIVDESGSNNGSATDGRFALQDFYLYLDADSVDVTESLNSGFVRVGIGVTLPGGGNGDLFSAEDNVGNFSFSPGQGLGGLPASHVLRIVLTRAGGGLFSTPATIDTELTLADFDGGALFIGADGGTPVIAGVVTDFGPSAVALVPEPATWALWISGLGAGGMALRRRRRMAAAT